MRIGFYPAISTRPRVNFVNNSKNNNQQYNQNSTYNSIEQTLEHPAFRGKGYITSIEGDPTSYLCTSTDNNPIKGEEKFGIPEYDALPIHLKGLARYRIGVESENVACAADRTAHLGVKLKKRLDRLYGKDNYVFVAIGPKVSLIGKAFEFQGVETRYLPTSPAKKWEQKFKENDLNLYADFMKTQDLSKDAMNNSSKKYLFFDCTEKMPGRLNELRSLMTTKFGLPEDKMEFKSLEQELKQVNASNDAIDNYLASYCEGTLANRYSSIGYLPQSNLSTDDFAPKKLTKYADDDVRNFIFSVIDKLNNIGAVEENPDNENAL